MQSMGKQSLRAIDVVTLHKVLGKSRPSSALSSRRKLAAHPQSGFVLLSVLFLVALIVLSLAVAAPRVAEDIRRDRESEYYHRGMQYQRAIRLYVRKMGHYPVSLDQLENTNEIRFLRRRYKDPMTGKDEWRLIHLGEAKVPPMGLFGQPMAVGVPVGALGSSLNDTSKPASGALGTDGSSTNTLGGTTGTGGVGFGGLAPGGAPTGTTGTGDAASTGSSTPLGGGIGFIVGVSSNSTRESIRTYKNQTHYNQWEFVYNPAEDKGGTGLAPAAPGTTGPNTPGSGPNPPGSAPNSPTSGPGFSPNPPGGTPGPPPGSPPP